MADSCRLSFSLRRALQRDNSIASKKMRRAWTSGASFARGAVNLSSRASGTDITGPLSFLGIANANVARMVINGINAKGGLVGQKIDLHLEDSATTDSVGEAKAKKLDRQELGGHGSEGVPARHEVNDLSACLAPRPTKTMETRGTAPNNSMQRSALRAAADAGR